MAISKVTSQGQVTLPKEIRTALNVRAGDRVAFRRRADGSVVVEAETVDAATLIGMLTPRTRVRGVTVEQMNDVIRKAGSKS